MNATTHTTEPVAGTDQQVNAGLKSGTDNVLDAMERERARQQAKDTAHLANLRDTKCFDSLPKDVDPKDTLAISTAIMTASILACNLLLVDEGIEFPVDWLKGGISPRFKVPSVRLTIVDSKSATATVSATRGAFAKVKEGLVKQAGAIAEVPAKAGDFAEATHLLSLALDLGCAMWLPAETQVATADVQANALKGRFAAVRAM